MTDKSRTDNLADQASRLAESIHNLLGAVQANHEQLANISKRMAIQDLIDDLEASASIISASYSHVAEHKEAYRSAKHNYEMAVTDSTVLWKHSQDGKIIDPTTGRSNKEYTEMLLEQHLQSDDVVTKEYLRMQEARISYEEAQAHLDGQITVMSGIRHQARLATSMLTFLAGPTQALGKVQQLVE